MEISIAELKTQIKYGQRILGLDLGSKTIGLALSDTLRMIASPMEVIHKSKFTKDAETLIAIIKEHNIAALVIGLPKNMDGSEGARCQSSRQFAQNFTEKHDVPIIFWDERLSTVAVTRTLLEADTSRKKRKIVVDKMAAAYILQGALDNLGHC